MKIAILVLAQILATAPAVKAPAHNTYTLTAAQTQQLAKAAVAHKSCMAQKDAQRRNDCFHPTHHAFWLECEAIKKELNADPSATCNLDTLEVKQ